MNVAVLGGHGFLGSRVLSALNRLPNVIAQSASRRGPVVVDLQRPETFSALDTMEVVIDFASTRATHPLALIQHCIEKGIVYFVGSSDRLVVESIHTALRETKGNGSVVLGTGIFTGMSNLLGRAASRRTPNCNRLQLGITTHPYSGAGQGTVDLMTDVLATPTLRYEKGQALEGPPSGPGPTFPFPEGTFSSLAVPLPETYMLHHSTSVPNVEVALSPRPGMLRWMFRYTPIWILRSRAFRFMMNKMFSFVRRVILKRSPSRVEIVALAHDANGSLHTLSLVAPDGMLSASYAVAGIVSQLQQGLRPSKACEFLDETYTLEATLEAANALAAPSERMTIIST